MWVTKNIQLRRATASDAQLLKYFLNYEIHVHRHLDWREPVDWLGKQPFWLLLRDDRVIATLACPADPPNMSWIRLFSSSATIDRYEAWNLLFEKAKADLQIESTDITIAAVSLRDWFTRVLARSGFLHHQDIVVLEWEPFSIEQQTIPEPIHLREMNFSDLNDIETIDRLAFSPFWHIPYDGLAQAFQQSTYSIVAEINKTIIGFQISASNPFGAHLSRLAVRPDMQRRYLGHILVNDLLIHFLNHGIDRITVNTQKTNLASIALYQSLNFQISPESFPVFIYPDYY